MLRDQMNLLLRRFIGRIVLYDIRLVLGKGIAAADAHIAEKEAAVVPDRPIHQLPTQRD